MNDRLDRAYLAMQAGGDEEGMAFYQSLADAELFLLLESEAEGEVLVPRVFDLNDARVLLAFDSEYRLAAFAEGPQAYAALPGRVIAAQMVGQGLSLGLNFGSGAPSETILPPEAMDWLNTMLDQAPPKALEARVAAFVSPKVPDSILAALPQALAGVERVHLCEVRYDDGRRGHLLALIGVDAEDQERRARAVTEALAFSGIQAGELDVVFLADDDPALGRMAGVSLVFEGEFAPPDIEPERLGPGMDPLKPPFLG